MPCQALRMLRESVHQPKRRHPVYRLICSSFVASIVVLAATTSTGTTHAEGREESGTGLSAPSCVAFSADWRYTFVVNNCSDTHIVKVVYRDGATVPCRVAPSTARITFPGYGPSGNEVLGVVLCEDGGRV
ncbi:alpha-amylase [Streptomyces sp. ALB3]|uniref:alpha-amylase n=1 Tax=Streptomyces sp. ALB3 TaxID=3374278 RepID=UPI0037937D2E